MKAKRILAATIVFACVFALCCCTPKRNDVETIFKDNGYVIDEVQSEYVFAYVNGYEPDGEVEYAFMAVKSKMPTAYVVAFAEKSDAKKFEEALSKRNQDNFDYLRKGCVVIFGAKQCTELFK